MSKPLFNPFPPIDIPQPTPNPVPTPDPPIVVPFPIPTEIPVPLPGFNCASYKDTAEDTFANIIQKLQQFLQGLAHRRFPYRTHQHGVQKIVGIFSQGFFGTNMVGIRLAFMTLYTLLTGIATIPVPGFATLFGGLANTVKLLRDTLIQRFECVIAVRSR